MLRETTSIVQSEKVGQYISFFSKCSKVARPTAFSTSFCSWIELQNNWRRQEAGLGENKNSPFDRFNIDLFLAVPSTSRERKQTTRCHSYHSEKSFAIRIHPLRSLARMDEALYCIFCPTVNKVHHLFLNYWCFAMFVFDGNPWWLKKTQNAASTWCEWG